MSSPPRVRAALCASLALFLMLLTPWAALAELRPDEVAVVARRGDKKSEGLARYYCRVRGVPAGALCLIDAPDQEEVPAELWRWSIRPEVRKWLDEYDPKRRLRCLVTTYGVPLKVAATPPTDELAAYRRFLAGERAKRMLLLARVAQTLDEIAGGAPLSELLSQADPDAAQGDLASAQKQLESALQAAQSRIAAIENDPQAKNAAAQRVQQLATLAGGARVLLQGLDTQLAELGAKSDPPATPTLRTLAVQGQFELLRGRASAFTEMKLLLDQRAPSIERDWLALTALQQTGGLLGAVQWLDEQLEVAKKNETGAALDSELALVLWPDDYQLLRWQPNYLRQTYDDAQLREAFPTMMVARLDAPTIELAKGLIDRAIEVEKAGGLAGKAYFDARGLTKLDSAPSQPGSYADYDQALLVTAKGIDDQTDLEVVLDERPELFAEGQCPDAALYCGWYSLAKYVDAFDWKPGAVAYHLASSEAATLHNADSQVWCKRMLEEGVAATIGPVYEPYLVSFPRPNEFFAALLSGEATLAEAYWRTTPFTSWAQVLVGDPLYKPFGK